MDSIWERLELEATNRLHRTRQLPLRDIAPVHADALLET